MGVKLLELETNNRCNLLCGRMIHSSFSMQPSTSFEMDSILRLETLKRAAKFAQVSLE